jgi:L-threonylcarbamoyladenylate synthase
VPQVLKLADPAHPSPALVEECLERLRRGELLAGATDTVYGLFCDPFNPRALERLVALKGRKENNPIPLLVSGPEQASRMAAYVSPLAELLMGAFWPGGLTIVVPARPEVPEAVTGSTASVGLRQPASPYLLRILEALGGPLTGTSANRSGQRPAATAEEVLSALAEELDAVIDGGRAERREASTVVEASGRELRVLRRGVVATESLGAVLGLPEGSL